jgi:hypothetical protein
MTMAKRRNLNTRAFGAEPGRPDVSALAGWVAERRGCAGDLISYQLETMLAPQKDAGITLPCAGGKFCRDRLLESFIGIEDGILTGETGIRPDTLNADAVELTSLIRGAWCAFPAPHLLNISDGYFGDADEACDALMELYRQAMRTMRDAGIGGNVLICDRADETELMALARQKVFFFHPAPRRTDLEAMLEYQRQIAAGPDQLEVLFALSEEYDLRRLILLDPDDESITLALSHLDPDQVTIGGYCSNSCDTYWKDLAGRAFYSL